MTLADRREFLRKLASGVAYSAPVVYSMAAPMDVVAQSGKGMRRVRPRATARTGRMKLRVTAV